MVIDPVELHQRAQAAPPRLGPASGALLSLLGRIDGRASIVELAETLHRVSPQLFPDAGSASVFVRQWTARLAAADRGLPAPAPDV